MMTGSLPEACYNNICFSSSYSLSGSYKGVENPFLTPYLPPTMAEALKEKDGEVKQYFEKLGYRVSWDFNTRSGERWWEIYDKEEGGLIVQIDMGVPLKYVIEDICSFHKGTPCIDRPDKPDWKFSGPDGPELTALLKKVYRYNNLQSRSK